MIDRRWRRPLSALLGTALLLTGVACGYVPGRFADAPPARKSRDDRPIPVPQVGELIDELHQADVYVRREIVKGLDLRRRPDALDVNAVDEVPTSSWFRGAVLATDPLADYERDGPPRRPLVTLDREPASGTVDATVVRDARGLTYELLDDLPERAGMRTSSAAIASRFLHALGYRVAEVYVVRHGGRRVAATRWPPGIDLGPTPIRDTRTDDPNDRIPHLDRRTLRAMKLVTAWLDIPRLRTHMLRDVYVGPPGRGHVEHLLVGFDGALGVDRYRDAVAFAQDPDRSSSNFFFKIATFGLSPRPYALVPKTPWPSVGLLEEFVLPAEFSPSPPFEPIDRLTPADIYWAAKRIAGVSDQALGDIIAAARLGRGARAFLESRLQKRRAQVVAWGLGVTTPLELVGVHQRSENRRGTKLPPRLQLADLSIVYGFGKGRKAAYGVRYLAPDGSKIGPDRTEPSHGLVTVIPVDEEALRASDYVVLRVRAWVDGKPMPRHLEVHVKESDGVVRVVGLRH